MLDDADSVPYSQTVSSFREEGKEKINEDDTSDQFFFFLCLGEIWGYFLVGMCLVL